MNTSKHILKQFIVAGLVSLLIAACVNNPSSTTGTAAQEADSVAQGKMDRETATNSELTQKETDETLKRLQTVRKKQSTDVYTGPIRHVWDHIRARPLITYKDNLRIEKQATLLLRDRGDLYRVSLRADPYIYYILQEIDKRNLPRELALLPIIESAYRATVSSRAKAVGLWQFIPATSKDLGMKTNRWYDARRDVIASTQYALDYLRKLNRKFKGDWLLTLAAYNGGIGKVSRAIAHNKRHNQPTDYWNLVLPNETRNYVPKFLAISRIFTHPAVYDVSLHSTKHKPHFAITDIKSQLDLKLAADLAGMSSTELKIYNPGFLRWATDPKGPHRLVLPVQKLNQFNKKFAQMDDTARLRWQKYKVKIGDSLTVIALKNAIGINLLKSVNDLKGSRILTGQTLLIPNKGRINSTLVGKSKRTRTMVRAGHFYVVESGDTLWRIAKNNRLTISRLFAMNNLDQHSIIRPGQRLRIKPDKTTKKVALRL